VCMGTKQPLCTRANTLRNEIVSNAITGDLSHI
jgi:hypothetical protein